MTDDEFKFNLRPTNAVTPKLLSQIDIMELIRTNNIPALQTIIDDLSQEKFDENQYFDFNESDLKIIKNYQVLTQYLKFSINQLEKKSIGLKNLTEEQIKYNQQNEQEIKIKKEKILEQQNTINELQKEYINLEYLIKNLNLQEKAKEEGINLDD